MITQNFFASMAPLGPAATQQERRRQLVEMASHLAKRCFDPSGVWMLPGKSPDARERLWLCLGLLMGSDADVAMANAILADTRFQHHIAARSEEEKAHPFDIFVSNHSVQILVQHADRLEPAVRLKMEQWARAVLNDYPGDRQSDYQFHGYNDNMPSKAAMGMILGGEYFGDAASVRHGVWSLRQLRDMLTRRGLVSEYASPTYSPLTVANLAEIATHAKDPEARELAAASAHRAWADLLGHFHPPTGMMGGPYSRAYTTDSVGHLSNMNFILWLTLGGEVWPNPLEELRREPPRLVLHHSGDLFFVVAQFSWLAAYEYNPPAQLLEWLRGRDYPFKLVATAERGEGGGPGGWAASEVLTTCYQERDFALGTSEGDWGGQAEELFLQYRLTEIASGVADVRTAYPRFLVNDEQPGVIVPNHNGLFQGEQDFLADNGRYHTVQHGGVAMVVVAAHPKLADKPVKRMGCAFILPEHLREVGRIEVADDHVWVEDGPIYFALRPLGAFDWGRGEPVRVESANRYRFVWFPNYEGPERAFTRAELERTFNGFVLVVGTAREGTFQDFRQRVSRGELLDYFAMDARTVRYHLDGLHLGINYGLVSNGVRFATINGKPVARPAWQADGLPAERLPFLGSAPVPNSLELPFEHLKVVWAPESSWQIFSRGNGPYRQG